MDVRVTCLIRGVSFPQYVNMLVCLPSVKLLCVQAAVFFCRCNFDQSRSGGLSSIVSDNREIVVYSEQDQRNINEQAQISHRFYEFILQILQNAFVLIVPKFVHVNAAELSWCVQ